MENDLRRIVDALPGLVWTARPDGQIDFVNRRWCDYTGLAPEQARGRGWQAAIHPDDLPEVNKRWASIVASGELREVEARLRRADGAYRWFHFEGARLTDAAGRPAGWCGICTDVEDLKRAAEGLRARESRFRLILDGIPALVTLMSPTGALEHVNRQVEDYFGAPLAELQSWKLGETIHPDDRAQALAAWRHSLETGQPCDFEARRRRADGAFRRFHMRGFPLRDAAGRIDLWYILHTDIEDQRRAEELLAGEKRLLELVAGGHALPGTLDALCHLVETMVSDCFCSIVLVDASGTKLREAIAPSLPAAFNDAVRDWPVDRRGGPCAMAAAQKIQVIMSDVAADTRWRNSWRALAEAHGLRSCWSTPILDTSGKVLGTFAMYYGEPKTPTPLDQSLIEQFTHIAGIAIERAAKEGALRTSEAFLADAQRQLRLTLDSIPAIVWRGAANGYVQDLNKRWFDYTGTTPEQVRGARWKSCVHPDDLDRLVDIGKEYVATGTPIDGEARLRRFDGVYRWFLFRPAPLRDETGKIVGWYGSITDIEDRKRAEEKAREAEEKIRATQANLAHMTRVMSMGTLTAAIAHEVNQPLAATIINADTCLRMLATTPPNLAIARETARRMIRDANRASQVIARLRELYARKGPSSDQVDLNEASREVIALSASELRRSAVAVRTEFAGDLPPVTGDRVQLQQVILNLLRNALDAMGEVHDRPRQLLIRTERDDGAGVRVTVRDTGVGFAPQAADKLFEAFYSTKSNGMGIGLSISRSIIESHEGQLWATPNDGPGATFSFSLPLKPEAPDDAAAAPGETARA
jgi:PAS domain S-box-containing protein